MWELSYSRAQKLMGIEEMMLVTFLHAPPITHVDKEKNTQNILTRLKVKKNESAEMEKKSIESFQSKSISAFSSAVTPHHLRAFRDKYSLKTSPGELILQKDLATLRATCKNKIPDETRNDRELLTKLLDKQIRIAIGTILHRHLMENHHTRQHQL